MQPLVHDDPRRTSRHQVHPICEQSHPEERKIRLSNESQITQQQRHQQQRRKRMSNRIGNPGRSDTDDTSYLEIKSTGSPVRSQRILFKPTASNRPTVTYNPFPNHTNAVQNPPITSSQHRTVLTTTCMTKLLTLSRLHRQQTQHKNHRENNRPSPSTVPH